MTGQKYGNTAPCAKYRHGNLFKEGTNGLITFYLTFWNWNYLNYVVKKITAISKKEKNHLKKVTSPKIIIWIVEVQTQGKT